MVFSFRKWVTVKCDAVAAAMIVVPWTGRTAVGRTDRARWRRKRAAFVVFRYRNLQRRIYHIRVFHRFVRFAGHLERTIDKTFEQYPDVGAREAERASESQKRSIFGLMWTVCMDRCLHAINLRSR